MRDGGDFDAALVLLQAAEAEEIDELTRGRAELVRAQIALQQRRAEEAGSLFMRAARRFEPLAPELARETYLEVLGGSVARDVVVPGGASAVAVAARFAPAAGGAPGPVEVLLDALSIRLTDGFAAAAPALARALELAIAGSPEQAGRPLSLSRVRDLDMVAVEMWDAEAAHVLAAREVQAARDTGAVGHLQIVLSFLARSHMLAGELSSAELLVDESRVIAESIGIPPLVNTTIILTVLRGEEAKASELIEASSREAASLQWRSSVYARSVLYNSLSRHDAAFDAAWEALRDAADARARRGGVKDRRRCSARVRAAMALTESQRPFIRVGQRDARACRRAAERRRGRRSPLPRVDRAPLGHPLAV
jgi:hypothetical protein